MRKSIALKTLLRSPLKTLLTFLLLAAASFALFSRVTDYAVTVRETKNLQGLYHATASLDNQVWDNSMMIATVYSPDKTAMRGYEATYEMEDKPWLTEEEMEEFSSLPGVTMANMDYRTGGMVENYKRLIGEGEYGGFFVFEGTYEGYEENESIPEDHILLNFDHVKVIARSEGPEIEESFTTEGVPLGETYYAKSPYTRAFYDSLETGSRCLVLAQNSGDTHNGSSGIYFYPYVIGEEALRVIDGEPDNYLETESFARQKGWVDAINHDRYVYDITYTSDMRAAGFSERWLSKGRLIKSGDTDVCVVSDEFLEAYGLSVGDSVSVQLGNLLCYDFAKAETNTIIGSIPDGEKVPEYTDSRELTIIGSYSGEGQPNWIYVPSALLPVEVPDDYEPRGVDFTVFVEDARDIEEFYGAVQQFADKVGLKLIFSDHGWLEVKDSLRMGAITSLLTTALYVTGAALALFLAVYLYIGRNKKSYAIMRMLGVSGKTAGNSVVLPFVVLSVLAVPAGGITGLYYAQRTAEKALLGMKENAPSSYVPDAALPVSVVFLCLLSELLFVSLAAYFFLRNMKKTPPLELLQEGARHRAKTEIMPVSADDSAMASIPANIDMAKLSAARECLPEKNYGPIRHVTVYIWRHMRRGMGRTAVSLVLTAVLAAGIGMFALAKNMYHNAFYELGVEGMAVNYTFSSVMELSRSPLVKDFYCQETFTARVQGAENAIPMTVTSDLTRDLGADCTVDYLQGYDISAFEGTGQVCLVGKELAEKLGVSPGDDINLLSDLLYSMLKAGEGGEDAAAGGFKTYKVIGIADTDDVSLKGNIFVGIRSDLEKLFSMDFTVTHCEVTLTDNEKIDELDALLAEKEMESYIHSPQAGYFLNTGGLADIERIRDLLEALFPIAVAAAVLIGLFGPLLVILQSAQEAAFLRILGVTKKRARCMLMFEQVALCLAGVLLVAGGLALSNPGLFAKSAGTLASCFGLYLLGDACGAFLAAVQVTRRKVLELLQVKE